MPKKCFWSHSKRGYLEQKFRKTDSGPLHKRDTKRKKYEKVLLV